MRCVECVGGRASELLAVDGRSVALPRRPDLLEDGRSSQRHERTGPGGGHATLRLATRLLTAHALRRPGRLKRSYSLCYSSRVFHAF